MVNLTDEQRTWVLEIRQDNPKRPGTASHARYEGYKSATTMEEFYLQGGMSGDIKNDESKGFMKVDRSGTGQQPQKKKQNEK